MNVHKGKKRNAGIYSSKLHVKKENYVNSILENNKHAEIELPFIYTRLHLICIRKPFPCMAHASLVALYKKDPGYLYENIEKSYKMIHENLLCDLKHGQIEHINGTIDPHFSMEKCARDIESAAKWMRSLQLAYQFACVHALPTVVEMDPEMYQSGEWMHRAIINCNCVEKVPHDFPAPSGHRL